jgi:small-conductance mechanosensitive channel
MLIRTKIDARRNTRWLKRFRPPLLLALTGAALVLSLPWLDGYIPPSVMSADQAERIGGVTSGVLFVIAIGWLVGTIVDALIKRRLARLHLDVADNLEARKSATRLDVVRRVWIVIAGLVTLAAALTIIPGVKQIGVSLFASAGIAGIAIGLAARPVLSNLIAGLQIAFTQPIRLDDAVVVEGEWGWIEEIGLFYVVIKIWDWRRLVVPLSYFIEQPFQNWTRKSASIIGTVLWTVDYHAPVGAMRQKLEEICKSTDLWNGDVVNLQVTEASGTAVTVRALASASTSPKAWDLRCLIREQMIEWLQAEHPEALPRLRADTAVSVPEDFNGFAARGS